jgi:hypothetical protein
VRQGQEHNIVSRQNVWPGLSDDAAGERAQVRLLLTQRTSRAGPGGEGPNLDLWVAVQQAKQLAPHIASSPGYGNLENHNA